jgi:FkbM family methyltransferase
MIDSYQSQCGEDRWIEEHWKELGLPTRGIYVEFGSGDGTHFSNTYFLQWEHSWPGLLIDADPRNVGARPGTMFERAAVGPAGVVSFGLHPTDGYLSGIKRQSENRIEVECEPLSSILRRRKINRVDLISIDTEGTELEAWRTLDLSVWRPAVAIIETETWGIQSQAGEVIAALDADGYSIVHQTELNAIFKSR